LERVRSDKGKNAKGNALKTARNLFASILYNITFEMLCTGLTNCYFEFKRSNDYKDMTKFINGVKQQQIRKIHESLHSKDIEAPVALDLGSGKG
jgi:hypothetical protein